MDFPIYELMINEDVEDIAEVSYVVLVDKPAIQRCWNAFKEDYRFKVISDEKRIVSGPLMLSDPSINEPNI